MSMKYERKEREHYKWEKSQSIIIICEVVFSPGSPGTSKCRPPQPRPRYKNKATDRFIQRWPPNQDLAIELLEGLVPPPALIKLIN